MKRYIIYIYIAALAICTACADRDINGDAGTVQPGNVPLRVRVGNIVELRTRGTDAGLQNSTLAPGARVGLFVMYERDYDSLRVGSSYHNTTYYYDNVECTLEANGALLPVDTTELFYPMGQDMKIAVFAYAPFDSTMTREALLLPKDSLYVSADQSTDSSILRNDLLLGTPTMGNPLRMPISDHTSSPYLSEGISLNLSHQRCQIVLDLKLCGTQELLQGQPLFHADTVMVYVENVPMSAPLGCSLDSVMRNYVPADSVVLDTMLMATYTDVFVTEGEEKPFVATGLVLPCSLPVEPSFCVVMISGNERRYIRRRATLPVNIERGTSVSFRTIVDAQGLLFE